MKQGTHTQRRFLAVSIGLACAIIVLSLLARYAVANGVSAPHATARTLGVFNSILLAAMGNVLPKILGTLNLEMGREAAQQKRQRHAGWSFVLAGAASVIGWLVLSVPDARFLMMGLCGGALGFIAIEYVMDLWTLRRASREPQVSKD